VRQESCTPCTTRAASGSLTRCSSTEAYIDSGRLVKVVLEAKDEQMKAEGLPRAAPPQAAPLAARRPLR